MKRNEINAAIQYMIRTLEENHLRMPAFAYWPMDEWRRQRHELGNLMAAGLGWDITDFGTGNFLHVGSALFTIRNGNITDPTVGTPYAEKYIVQRHETEQEIPFHFHRMKTEDIINRGGSTLMLELFNSLPNGALDRDAEIHVKMDGVIRTLPGGAIVEIGKGCSITLHAGLYHRFWAKKRPLAAQPTAARSINGDRGSASASRLARAEAQLANLISTC